MDYEKKYKEALEKARQLYAYPTTKPFISDLQDLFPELKESEDEKMRAMAIKAVYAPDAQSCIKSWGINPDDVIAWLEKQGKTSPILSNSSNIGKVEPKFKFGDWVVVNDGRIGRISECTKDFADIDLEFSCLSTSPNNIRPWTIQDAKDGDMLATEDWVFIFKKMNSNEKPVCYCHYDIELGFRIDTNSYIASGSEIYPATKEQRDLLFQKMKDAGYTFDFEKKELKKVEQKPAEDRYMEGYLNGINDTLKPSAWSEKDDIMKQHCHQMLALLRPNSSELTKDIIDNCHHWLKSLKERVQPQPKQEWSKEDRETIDYLIDYLESELDSSYTDLDKKTFTKEINWLKSLRPKNRWKPSDEQMTALRRMKAAIAGEGEIYKPLNSLYEDLKKLREE